MVRVRWADSLRGEFDELVLTTLVNEGEDATLARLLAKLDEVPISVRRDHLYLLTIVPGDPALAWLEARIESPVVAEWGCTAALLGIRWDRIATWMARGRPHSLAALDALTAYAYPSAGSSPLLRAVQPVLSPPPSVEELRGALTALCAVDDSPRVAKSADAILAHASEILRGGPSLGISARTFFERSVDVHRAQQLLWAESRRHLPLPEQALAAGPELRLVWERRWAAAVRACGRRGGSGSVRVGPTLEANELAAIQRQVDFVIPSSVADVLTRIAGDVDMSWTLPETSDPPAAFKELTWGGCAWDARRLPRLEHVRRSWVENAFSDPENEYGRVWRDKLALFDLANGDMVAVDLSRADTAPVVYLSHDGGDGHGRVLGYSFVDFIDRWTLLGCVGPEEWLLAPFLHRDRPYLDPAGDVAAAWRAWFGLDVPAAG